MRTIRLILTLFVSAMLATPAFAVHDTPRIAWPTPNPDYPLKLHILTVERSHSDHLSYAYTTTYGSGNFLGDPNVGFDFNSGCDGGFIHNAHAGEYYQGRWKEPNHKVEILMVEVGSKQLEKCIVNVTPKSVPYTHDNPPPHLVTAR